MCVRVTIQMLPAGMPELERLDDITYLLDKLNLRMTDKEATLAFKGEISKSLQTVSRQFDNMIHQAKHRL